MPVYAISSDHDDLRILFHAFAAYPGTARITLNKKDLLQLTSDLRFIPGIYNYCDRWCERCSFTSRCLNYAMTEDMLEDSIARDPDNRNFGEEMQILFEQTCEMITEMPGENGTDPDSPDSYLIPDEIELLIDEVENHYLALAADEYSKKVNDWFDIEYPLFDHQRHGGENIKPETGTRSTKSRHFGVADLKETIEAIKWYQHQIHAKLVRALSGDDLYDDETESAVQSDADGSAKVALIGIDRSISAWGRLKEYFPDNTDRILDILLLLDRIRRKTEQEFPSARAFIRPGFDALN